MNLSKLLVILLLIAIFVTEVDSWRRRRRRWSLRRVRFRRRRRRRVCHVQSCGYYWYNYPCSCSTGKRLSILVINRHPKCGGTACPRIRRRETLCIPTSRRDCLWSWGRWSRCTCKGEKFSKMIINRKPTCGGTPCPRIRPRKSSCIPKLRRDGQCNWGGWSRCTCPGKSVSKMIITKPKCGGTPCRPSTGFKTKLCIPKSRRDCYWSWGNWSNCDCTGFGRRRVRIHKTSLCGGKACPTYRTKKGPCNSGKCVSSAGTCNYATGQCKCNNGTQGLRCQLKCPVGKYGFKCSQKCKCVENIDCGPMDGTCLCPDDRSGKRCEIDKCANGGCEEEEEEEGKEEGNLRDILISAND